MCTIKDMAHAIEREVELKLYGYQTSFVKAEFVGQNHLYKLLPSERTRAKFEDIVGLLRKSVKTSGFCYQIPESQVPKAKLESQNIIGIVNFFERDKSGKKSRKNSSGEKEYFVQLKKEIQPGHLLCVAPSIRQETFQIFALERLCGQTLATNEALREKVNRLHGEHPLQISPKLSELADEQEISSEKFEVPRLGENEFLLLTDNQRKGADEQRRFVEIALATPDFAFLEGPPGSGKTTVIVELLHQLIKRRKRILLVASTNVAVDNILEKLYEIDGGSMANFCAKRYGDSDNSKVSFAAKKFIPQNFAATESELLKKRLGKISFPSDEQKFLSEKGNVKDNPMLYEILEANAPIVAGTTFGAAIPEIQKLVPKTLTQMFLSQEPPFDYLILDESSKTTFQEFLVPAILCKHWIIVGDIRQLPPYVDSADLAYNLRICYPEKDEDRKSFTAASDALLVSKNSGKQQVCILIEKESEYDSYLYKKFAAENKILIADADKESERELLPFASIILGSVKSFVQNRGWISPRITTVRTAKDPETGRDLHEDKMQEWIAIARYNREKVFKRFSENFPKEWHDEMSWRIVRLFEQRDNVINVHNDKRVDLQKEIEKLIPDIGGSRDETKRQLEIFKQVYLPSCMELFLRGFGAFKTLQLFRGLPKEFLDPRKILLSYQHRSHPDIAEIASEEFYENRAMKSSEEIRQHRTHKVTERYGKSHNFWADVRGYFDARNRNAKEQKWIENDLKNLVKYAPPQKKLSVAVLSFYKEQAEELKKLCKKVFKGKKNILYAAGSVDSFQGHEADIVFLSYANNHPTCFIEAPNRLNVAITRARYMMIHVGNWNAMAKASGSLGRITNKLKSVTQKF